MHNPKSQIKQATNKQKPLSGSYIAVCTIVDSFAHAGTYVVQLPAGMPIQASDISQGTGVPVGARSIAGYPPKSRVLCVFDENFEHGYILGGAPRGLSDSRLIIPESIVLRSRVGMCEDPMHFTEFNDPKSLMSNFSAGRPADALPGDWGYVNELGVAILIGKAMAVLKGSEGAKIEAFSFDDLLRLVGNNYELFTAGMEDRKINDEGEYSDIVRITPYPWEALGVRNRGTNPVRTADGTLEPGSEDTPFEPQEDDQLIVPRHTIMRGYLGDLERQVISAPPETGDYETFESEDLHRGLASVHKNSDGMLTYRSAKGIVFEKYSLIPVPKELVAPEDPTGDSVENGYQPSGTDVQIPEYQWGDADNPTARASQMYEYLAWFHGRYTSSVLDKHTKDWKYPNESEIEKPQDGSLYDKSLSDLESKFFAPLPSFTMIKLDHRSGRDSVRYYKSRSAISMLDDGGVMIEDGYGSQFIMSGGNIMLTAPGDIWRNAGRSTIDWAGFDSIMRAGNSAEISAAKHDVRIKAEINCHLLAGNSEEKGAILLESRADGLNMASDWSQIGERVNSHGVIIKCPKSSFHAMAGDVYIGCDKESDRKIVCIDATDEGQLYMRGKDILGQIKNLFAILENEGEKQLMAMTAAALVVSTPNNLIGGNVVIAPADGGSADLYVGGGVSVHGSAIFNGGVATNQGFAARTGAPLVGKLPAAISVTDPSTYGSIIQEQIEQVGEMVDSLEEIEIESAETSPGNAEFRDKIGFSCRDSEEDVKLDSSSFVLFEARWQQLLRLGSAGGGHEWDEPIVKAPTGEETLPHPGKQAWKDWQAFGKASGQTNFDFGSGRANDRDGMTETGQAAEKSTLSSGYKIVKEPNS